LRLSQVERAHLGLALGRALLPRRWDGFAAERRLGRRLVGGAAHTADIPRPRLVALAYLPHQTKISVRSAGWHETDVGRWIADPASYRESAAARALCGPP
jgi:hypothetical protein